MEEERIGLQNNLMEIEKAIAEAETKEEFFREMTEREKKLFSDFMEKLEAEGMGMEQAAGVAIMEKMEKEQEVIRIFRDNEMRMEKYLEEQEKETPVEQEDLVFRGEQEELSEEEIMEELPEEAEEEIIEELQEDIEEEIPDEITEEQEMLSSENEEAYGAEEE